jgi:hypothetical protein
MPGRRRGENEGIAAAVYGALPRGGPPEPPEGAQREDGTILLPFLCAPYSPLWLKILQIFQRFSGFEE